ncbi:MAG: hypothetical protein ACRDNS_20090 [Trebonia sp.]
MEQISRPTVLDASGAESIASEEDAAHFRPVSDAQHVKEVIAELSQGCNYGAALWEELDRERAYLLELAGDGGKPSVLRGGDDWEAWAHRFAEVTSALAGPTGDSGYGAGEARRIAQEHSMTVLG